VHADAENDVLACMAGASADIDGSKSYTSDAYSIRFLLTLKRKKNEIYAVHVKYTGAMEEMPSFWYQCSVNRKGNLYTCANGTDAIWYYPKRKHGVMASISIVEMIEENRANSAGIYNYSCTVF